MQNLIQKIIDWANERNLIKGSTPAKQGLKLMSEYGELCDSIVKNDLDGIKDGIGDVAVVAIIINTQYVNSFSPEYYDRTKTACTLDGELAEFVCCKLSRELMYAVEGLTHLEDIFHVLECVASEFGLNFIECLQHAYNEIKDRKGVMYKGVFIKESDPRYENAVKELSNEL